MTLVYTFLILFLFLMTGILTSYNQRNKYYDIIEEQIKSEMNLTSFRNNTLYNTILKDNKAYPDNTDASPSVDSKDGIDFSKPSSLTNGIGLFYTGDTSYTNDNKTVYYFRGSDVNNYILTNFGMYRILRTTEDGNIKIIIRRLIDLYFYVFVSFVYFVKFFIKFCKFIIKYFIYVIFLDIIKFN